jgi:serine/threonine-protein kinase HipA
MSRQLDVYLNDLKAGVLTQDDAGDLGFSYAADYLADGAVRAISFSMPLRETPYGDRIVRPFFSGLLPDERARQHGPYPRLPPDLPTAAAD